MRMFLRHLIAEGKCRTGLDDAVPSLAMWRLSALPRYLPAADIERVIAACERETTVGLRDRAAILLLARLGLRAGDIVKMDLSDLDWVSASVRVSGKSVRVKLPITQEVGDAILEYLRRGRPPVQDSRLFVRVLAPWKPLKVSSVPAIVERAIARAGVEAPFRRARTSPFGCHRDVAPRRHARTGWHRPPPSVCRHNGALCQGRRAASPEHRSSVAGGVPMLSQLVDSYLELRRSTGFGMKVHQYLLHGFASFAAQRGETHIRTCTAIEWATQAPSEGQRANRLGISGCSPASPVPKMRVMRSPPNECSGHDGSAIALSFSLPINYMNCWCVPQSFHRVDRSGHGPLRRFSRCWPSPACAFPRR